MAVYEKVSGRLVRVDTDKKQIVLEMVGFLFPEWRTFDYRADISKNSLVEKLGLYVKATLEDGVVIDVK